MSVARSITAASPAETSGRRCWTSGSSSRTCFIATATWFSALNGNLSGQHLEEHDAQRVDVRLTGHRPAEGLLGGDVVGRPEHPPVCRQALLGQRAGDPEVGDQGPAVAVDEDVLRLHVAMDDVRVVGRAERTRELDRVSDGLRDLEPSEPADALFERLALDVLEDDVRRPVVLAGVDHRDDVRVAEPGDGPRLAPEALERVGVRGDLAVQRLDRDLALEHRVEAR